MNELLSITQWLGQYSVLRKMATVIYSVANLSSKEWVTYSSCSECLDLKSLLSALECSDQSGCCLKCWLTWMMLLRHSRVLCKWLHRIPQQPRREGLLSSFGRWGNMDVHGGAIHHCEAGRMLLVQAYLGAAQTLLSCEAYLPQETAQKISARSAGIAGCLLV